MDKVLREFAQLSYIEFETALEIVSNVFLLDDELTVKLLKKDVLEHLLSALRIADNEKFMSSALWAAGNIASCDDQ